MDVAPTDDSGALARFDRPAGPAAGEPLPVRTPAARIGQGPQNDVVIEDDSVSRAHAALDHEGGGWRLTDLDSTNGTYVNGVRLAPRVPTPLPDGAEVRFGGVALLFQADPAADVEGARARHAGAAAEAPRVTERSGGFRLPVWVALLILIVLGVIVFFLVRDPSAGTIPGVVAPLALPVHAAALP
ncbi:MAG TPA: FHA domain-containing protein [Longimicrobiaceae bacterium]|nr:FHA domain-containing protein [Longimicrobiaceae bacterium]